jgi:hypothetical protein
MRKIRAFEIEAHGVEHAQFFQGAGLAFTNFDAIATGAGENAQEAYEDAADQLAMEGWDTNKLPSSESALRRRGLHKSDSVARVIRESGEDPNERPDDCELYYYVTIRVR